MGSIAPIIAVGPVPPDLWQYCSAVRPRTSNCRSERCCTDQQPGAVSPRGAIFLRGPQNFRSGPKSVIRVGNKPQCPLPLACIRVTRPDKLTVPSFSFTPTFPLARVNRPDPIPKAYITRGPMVRIRLPPAASQERTPPSRGAAAELWSSLVSPLEEAGFELAVPPRTERLWGAFQVVIAVWDLNL